MVEANPTHADGYQGGPTGLDPCLQIKYFLYSVVQGGPTELYS